MTPDFYLRFLIRKKNGKDMFNIKSHQFVDLSLSRSIFWESTIYNFFIILIY